MRPAMRMPVRKICDTPRRPCEGLPEPQVFSDLSQDSLKPGGVDKLQTSMPAESVGTPLVTQNGGASIRKPPACSQRAAQGMSEASFIFATVPVVRGCARDSRLFACDAAPKGGLRGNMAKDS